jgi:hypothetical protein
MEVTARSSRIKINQHKKRDGDLFTPAGESEVLPSVSSRNKHRAKANVVTSGNRFIRCRAPNELMDCILSLEGRGSQRMANHFIASKHPLLMRRVIELVSMEEREAALYFRRIHDL